MSPSALSLLRDGITIVFGALAGGLTNRIAIIMLFHPYEPPRIMGRTVGWLQGAVPKNRKRMASTIGRTIGTHLLSPEDVAAELRDERLREAFDVQLRGLIRNLLEDEKPALADLLSEPALDDARVLLGSILDTVHARLIGSMGEDVFANEAARVLGRIADALDTEPLEDALPPERLADLRNRAEIWLDQLADSDSFEDAIRGHLERAAVRLLQPGRSLEELIPPVLVGSVEQAIADYLPIAMERLGRTLEDPHARARVESTIHELLDRFMRDLAFHQRVVAKLIITEDTVEKVIDTLEAEGADRLGDLLRENEIQGAMARGVNEAIVEYLRRPVVDVLGAPDDDRVQSTLDSLSIWMARTARDTEVRTFLLDRIEGGILTLRERSWGDLVRIVPADKVGGWLESGLSSDTGRKLYADTRGVVIEKLLYQPLGSLASYGDGGAVVRITDALSDPVWDWISSKVPEVAAKVRVADRVEEKIVEFPLEELERIIRSVTDRELDLIVRLGYILGAGIGLTLVLVGRLIG